MIIVVEEVEEEEVVKEKRSRNGADVHYAGPGPGPAAADGSRQDRGIAVCVCGKPQNLLRKCGPVCCWGTPPRNFLDHFGDTVSGIWIEGASRAPADSSMTQRQRAFFAASLQM